MDRIPYPKVQEFIKHQVEINNSTFANIEATHKPTDDVLALNKQTLKFKIKSKLEEVWLHYANVSPDIAWNGKKINYSMLISKEDSKLYYYDDPVGKIEKGQIVLLNLKFLCGLYNQAVGFEITLIDPEKKLIEFSYIEGNDAEGKQQLLFEETEDGATRILHTSYFKSKSHIRDFLLYPYFHSRVTKEFHHNMRESL